MAKCVNCSSGYYKTNLTEITCTQCPKNYYCQVMQNLYICDQVKKEKKQFSCIFSVHSYITVITLCTYAQQGYAFGRIGLCAYVRIYILKKQAV